MGLPAIKLDTLSIAKDLEDSGVPGIQAQSQIRATVKVINMVIEEKLVTKQDLAESEKRLSGAINDVDKRVISIEQKLTTLATEQAMAQLDRKLSDRITSLEHRLENMQLTLSLRMG